MGRGPSSHPEPNYTTPSHRGTRLGIPLPSYVDRDCGARESMESMKARKGSKTGKPTERWGGLCPTTEQGHDTTSEHETSDGVSQLGVRAVDQLLVEQELVCKELRENDYYQDPNLHPRRR